MQGVVNLDKPAGPTSHDMVALLRRLTGIRRVGHAGTLDPLASGVLPILIGQATRFSEELSGGDKRYAAVVRLGATSPTDDAEGPVTISGIPPPPRSTIETALKDFEGTVEQRPPAFSARKLGGRAAYHAARAGRPLDIPPRRVTIHSIRLAHVVESAEGWTDASLEIHCASGTYVRSIARDLGERLGCGGYLRSLRRTQAAGLDLGTAHRPEALEEMARDGRLAAAVLPVAPLLPLPEVELDDGRAARFAHGVAVPVSAVADGRFSVLAGGRLLGIGVAEGGTLRPAKVIPPGPAA